MVIRQIVNYFGYQFFLSGDKNDTHAGVGFIVSPHILKYIGSFVPINSRLAILKLYTNHRKTWLYSCYAPSVMASNIENVLELDADRKQKFWDSLHDHTPVDSSTIPALMGDFNCRLLQRRLMPPYVGEHAFLHLDTSTQFALNSDFMTEFLQSHNLQIKSTFASQPAPQKITYLEIQSDEYCSSFHPTNRDFSQLDHVLLPIPHTDLITCPKSMVDISFPSRHFPVLSP